MGVTNSNKVINADRIECDGSLKVTLALTAAPDIVSNPTDIVLVLDRSGSMAGAPLAAVKAGSKSFIDIIAEATGGAPGQIGAGSQIGVVSFSDTATTDSPLTDSVDQLKNAVDLMVSGGSTNHAAAFQRAMDLLDPVTGKARVIVLFTDGNTTSGLPPAPVAAEAKARGIIIYCIGLVGTDGLDVNALNPAILQKFLSNGLQEETENFVKDYFYAIGQEPMESLVFRNYVILNVRFSVISFIKGLGCDTNEMESADTEEVLAESGKNMESAIAYAKKMISQAIEIRDQNSGNKNRSILKTAVDFIDSHYMDEEISLNTVANVANVSSNHFSALFSQNMGQTFIEYLTSLRMNKAKELLRCTGMRSSEIAGEIGYKDAHYFSYLFKKTQGMTPSDYRKAREEKA